MTLTHRQRVQAIFAGEPVDRPPAAELVIADDFMAAYLRRMYPAPGEDEPDTDARSLSPVAATIAFENRLAVVEQLGLDAVVVSLAAGWEGTEPDIDSRLEEIFSWRARSDLFVFALIDGPFTGLLRRAGFENGLMLLSQKPDLASWLCQAAGEQAAALSRQARDAGADAILIGDDLAYQRGPFAHPDRLRRAVFPVLRGLVAACHAYGLRTLLHSDGNLLTILPDLLAIGLDGLHGVEPAAGMSLVEVRRRSGPGFVLWGGLDPDSADEEDIQTAISAAGPCYILGTCSGLAAGIRPLLRHEQD